MVDKDDIQPTRPGVWHKLPTNELKMDNDIQCIWLNMNIYNVFIMFYLQQCAVISNHLPAKYWQEPQFLVITKHFLKIASPA